MKIVTLFFNIVCIKCCLSISNPNELQMIVDVIASYEQPTVVAANVCWKTSHKLTLATMLSKGKPISIRYLRENETIANLMLNNHLLFLVDVKCQSSRYLLVQANANKMFNKTYRWLVLGKINTIMEHFPALNILVDSDFVVAEEQVNGDFILQAMYKIKPRSEWVIDYYGTWTINSGFTKSEDSIISNAMKRKDLKGMSLITSLIITDNRTKNDYADLSNIFVDPVTKSAYQTISNVYEFLNATRVMVFSDTWGYLVNASWSGMIGDIDTGKADLCGSLTFITKERLNVVEYTTVPAGIPVVKLVFRQPPLSYQFNLFILPFTTSVWYSLGGFVVILIIILYINAKWDIKKYEDYKEEIIDETYLTATWSDIILFVLSAISQQGSSNELKGTLGRLVMFLVFLAFVFFYTSYSANIIVLLQSTSDQIRTVSDLTNSKLEVGIEDVVYNKYYFTANYARDPVRKAFYETKVAPRGSKPNYMSLEEGVKRLRTKPFAFNMNVGSGYTIISRYFQEHEKCGLQEIDYIQASKPSLCNKKNSPYSEIYKVGFLRIEEHGLSDRNNRKIFAKKPTCSVTSGNFGSVNMVDFYPVLLMLLYGILLAFVLLVLEILVHRRQNIKQNLIRLKPGILGFNQYSGIGLADNARQMKKKRGPF